MYNVTYRRARVQKYILPILYARYLAYIIDNKIYDRHFFPPPIAFFVLQKGIEGGLEEIVVCGVECIVYSILPLRVLLNLKQLLVLQVGKNVSVVVGESASLRLADRYLL